MNSTREVGNVRFDALRDLDDRSRFTLVEIYSDEASKNEHKIAHAISVAKTRAHR